MRSERGNRNMTITCVGRRQLAALSVWGCGAVERWSGGAVRGGCGLSGIERSSAGRAWSAALRTAAGASPRRRDPALATPRRRRRTKGRHWCTQCRWESQLVHGTPPHAPIPTHAPHGFPSEARTSGETQEHVGRDTRPARVASLHSGCTSFRQHQCMHGGGVKESSSN